MQNQIPKVITRGLHTAAGFTAKKSETFLTSDKFVGHAATVSTVDEVQSVLDYLQNEKKFSSATHLIYAYRLGEGETTREAHQDCGEPGNKNERTQMQVQGQTFYSCCRGKKHAM